MPAQDLAEELKKRSAWSIVCFRASLANGRELLPEDSLELALWNLRYRVGVLSGRRGRSLDPNARNAIADPSRNAYCHCIPTETS